VFEIGNSLREARLRQSLDFPDVERVTKIRPKYLRALEDEQFEILPAQTYVKGFLRTYAEFLGLDGQLYVDEYNSRYVTRAEDEVPFRPRRSTAGRGRSGKVQSAIVLSALLGISVVFALVIAAWNSGAENEPPSASTQPQLRTPVAADLVIRAVRGTTRMTVRENDRFGAQRFAGTVENGRTQRFALRGQLWLWIQRPATVDLVVGGRTVGAPGNLVIVNGRGVSRAPAS
jgi:cytoskeletal protein RodZ